MRGESGLESSFDLGAVGSGILWGLMLMLVGSLVQGVYDYGSPLSPAAGSSWTYAVQGLGGLLAGFRAGRRARGAGLLHGGIAGAGLALIAALMMGVLTELPAMGALFKSMGLGLGLGAVAGITAVNLTGR